MPALLGNITASLPQHRRSLAAPGRLQPLQISRQHAARMVRAALVDHRPHRIGDIAAAAGHLLHLLIMPRRQTPRRLAADIRVLLSDVVLLVRVGVQILFVELAPARGQEPVPEGSLH